MDVKTLTLNIAEALAELPDKPFYQDDDSDTLFSATIHDWNSNGNGTGGMRIVQKISDKAIRTIAMSQEEWDEYMKNISTTYNPVSESIIISEATKKYSKRSEIPDDLFGLPSVRKFRLDDPKHVSSAIGYFRTVKSKANQKILATNIIAAIRKFNMKPNVSPDNPFYKYLPDDLKQDTINETVKKVDSLSVVGDELAYKFNEWQAKKDHNVLFITGLSGSGKSTRAEALAKEYKAEHICLDDYEHARKHFCKYADEFMDSHEKYKKLSMLDWKNTEGDNLIEEFYEGAALYFKWLMAKIKATPNQLFIIEGIQIFSWGREVEVFIKNKPIIIKLTKPELCRERIIKRDVNNTDGGQHDLPKLTRHYNYLKYFIKRMGISYDLKAYDPPLNVAEIKKYYPDKSDKLLADPVHRWRAENGIELIHREPSFEEQMRVWNNWNLMTDHMKSESNKKSIELNHMTNLEMHEKLMKTVWKNHAINETIQVEDRKIVKGKRYKTKHGTKVVPVYVVLTKSGTPFGKAIRVVTKAPYNHASITMDPELNNIFSFGGQGKTSGFILESLSKGRFAELAQEGSEYALYVTFIAEEKYKAMEVLLEDMLAKADEFSYSMKGVINYLLNKTTEEADKMFCSEFVAKLLHEADVNLINNHPSLTAPMDLVTDKFYKISDGPLMNYNPENTKKEVTKLRKRNSFKQYLTENATLINAAFYGNLGNTDLAKVLFANSEVYDRFYPTYKFPLAVINAKSLGGILPRLVEHLHAKYGTDEEDVEALDSLIEIYYDPMANMFPNTAPGTKDDKMHLILAAAIQSGYYTILKNKPGEEGLKLLDEWNGRVRLYYTLFIETEDMALRYQLKQAMFDLCWYFGDNPYDNDVIRSNIIYIALSSGAITPINEDSILDTKAMSDFYHTILQRSMDVDYLSPMSNQYPVIDFDSLLFGAIEFEDMKDPDEVAQFIKVFNELLPKYSVYANQLIPCTFKIAKYIPTQYILHGNMQILKSDETEAVNESISGVMQGTEVSDGRFGFVTIKNVPADYLFGVFYSEDNFGRRSMPMNIPFEGESPLDFIAKTPANCTVVESTTKFDGFVSINYHIKSSVPITKDTYLVMSGDVKKIPAIKQYLEDTKLWIDFITTKNTGEDELNEGIKTPVYNFSLDDDGNLLIESKERSDFPTHYAHSVKILKTYKKVLDQGEIVPEGVKHELCKLYYMAQLIELHYIRNASKLNKDELKRKKEMLDTRALILNTFELYMGLVLKIEPNFNFQDYFAKSKYGDTIKVSQKEIKTTIDLVGYAMKLL